MEFLGDYFKGYPSQQKVAGKLLSCGIRVADGHAYCGDIEQGDSAIGRACGVDRRVVRSTLERISSTPELDAIFTKVRPMLPAFHFFSSKSDPLRCFFRKLRL